MNGNPMGLPLLWLLLTWPLCLEGRPRIQTKANERQKDAGQNDKQSN